MRDSLTNIRYQMVRIQTHHVVTFLRLWLATFEGFLPGLCVVRPRPDSTAAVPAKQGADGQHHCRLQGHSHRPRQMVGVSRAGVAGPWDRQCGQRRGGGGSDGVGSQLRGSRVRSHAAGNSMSTGHCRHCKAPPVYLLWSPPETLCLFGAKLTVAHRPWGSLISKKKTQSITS